jgi:hypothetical protein
MEPLPLPSTVDVLTEAIDYMRPLLERSIPVTKRMRELWAGVVAARDLGASDVVELEFLQLAHETGLFADLGRHADDVRHVIRWAMIDQNPFQ